MNFITISCNVCLLTSCYLNFEKGCIECDDHFEYNPTTAKGPIVRRECASLFQLFTVGLYHCKLTGLVLIMVSDFVVIYLFILVKSFFSWPFKNLTISYRCRQVLGTITCPPLPLVFIHLFLLMGLFSSLKSPFTLISFLNPEALCEGQDLTSSTPFDNEIMTDSTFVSKMPIMPSVMNSWVWQSCHVQRTPFFSPSQPLALTFFLTCFPMFPEPWHWK